MTKSLRSLVLVGAMGAAALTLGSAGPVAAGPCGNGCHGDEPGEPGYDEAMQWLYEYEEDLETTYGQSENGVMAGPNGEGDAHPGRFPFPLP